ncbi:CGNR zinc finger domain-containing protein [Nocardioides bruguierae]|uniref:CGNR zinc finger domain-containing protein n=1 Tax=Nocardioides bruguierae TaxID=2945102 RepID=A0A9X2DBC3_9ACTN|nr:CGNR zinc finger domain-containing protein [Nocardioides bruguierae]MCM0622860.1 CGNR zinc finger domain-containing protein [Nocardioides bruguierae]
MEKFGFIGGHVTLDLVNTVHWRVSLSRRFEALATYDDLVTWSGLAGVLEPAEAELLQADSTMGARALDDVRRLREAFYLAAVHDDFGAAGQVAKSYRTGLASADLALDGDAWGWRDAQLNPRTPIARLSRAMVEFLTSDRHRLIRQCGDDECGWVYLDTSRGNRRRWCSATGCGDRNRARAYYRRRNERTT